LALLMLPFAPVAAVSVGILAVTLLAMVNAGFLRLVGRTLGAPAAAQAVGVLFVHFLCAGAGFAWALAERMVIQRA
jgi:hypothetical protein